MTSKFKKCSTECSRQANIKPIMKSFILSHVGRWTLINFNCSSLAMLMTMAVMVMSPLLQRSFVQPTSCMHHKIFAMSYTSMPHGRPALLSPVLGLVPFKLGFYFHTSNKALCFKCLENHFISAILTFGFSNYSHLQLTIIVQ